MLGNTVIISILILVLGGAVGYIIKAKKSGAKCIGCPHSKTCASNEKNSGCSCCGNKEA